MFQVSAVFAGVLKMTLVTIRITEPAGGLMALYIVLLGVFLAVILLCVLLSVHMAIEVEADYDDF